MHTQINWDATKEETEVITKIAQRAVKLAAENEIEYDFMCAQMDITAVHLNDCKLKLEELNGADEANFGHDIFGIRKYIDRSTGKLTNCFLPRYSA